LRAAQLVNMVTGRRPSTPSAVPSTNEAVIAVVAASLNRGELSSPPSRPGWTPGQDVARTVITPAADGSGLKPGTRVTAVSDQAGRAERVAAPTYRLRLGRRG